MHKVETEVTIAAPAADVWRVLMDWPSYPEWNPNVRRIEGDARVGARLKVRLRNRPFLPIRLQPTLVYLTPERYLAWRGAVLGPFILEGERYFELIPTGPERCRMRIGERFTGLLTPAFGALLARIVEPSFVAMNEALRVRVEAHPQATQRAISIPKPSRAAAPLGNSQPRPR